MLSRIKKDEETHLYSMSVHHPTGITVEIVGIEASGNGRSCCQHDVCGSVLDDDVVVRLRKVQIINSSGKEETAIAAYLVSDGIDQCRVGFLQRHFVPHARSFDGVLAQVTEVYSITSESPIKRKKCRHNMGCCLAALISELPPTANTISASNGSMSTNSFLRRIARQDEEEEEDTTRLLLQRNESIVNYDDPSSALPAAAPAVQQTTTNVASTPPPAAITRAPQHSNTGQRDDATRRLLLLQRTEQVAITNYDDPPSALPAALPATAPAIQQTTTNVASTPPPAAARVPQHSNSGRKNNDEFVRKRKVDDLISRREQDEEDNNGCS
jgi:hypothetical protein